MHSLDVIDRHIIASLQEDGRTSNVEVARRVGVSEATVRKRLERLVSEDIIHITAIPCAERVGLTTSTFLTLDVELSQVDRIADELANSPHVRSIYYTTGASDLIVEAWFPSGDELLRFLTQYIAAIPGIKRTATSHVLRTIKDGSRWILPPTVPPRVLVVDDDPDFIEITRVALRGEGFEVIAASSGDEALASMRVSLPDAVILDVMMNSVLDGLQTAREMRSDPDLRSVPILLVSSITSSAFSALLPEEERLPVDDFLVKPIEAAQIVAQVKRLARLH